MRTWIEIDKENLKYNVLKLKEIANNKEVLGVVKANAYGLGSIEIAKILKEVEVKLFGVANLEEAIELQEAGIKDKILILGASFEDELVEATKRGVHVAISSMGQLQFLVNNYAKKFSSHFFRIEVDCDDYRESRKKTLEELALNLAKKSKKIGKPVELEPMTSVERKIIHNALTGIKNVETESRGEEPYRYLVITAK